LYILYAFIFRKIIGVNTLLFVPPEGYFIFTPAGRAASAALYAKPRPLSSTGDTTISDALVANF